MRGSFFKTFVSSQSEDALYLQPCTPWAFLWVNKLMQAGPSCIIRNTVDPRDLTRDLLVASPVPFLKRGQILYVRQLEKFQDLATNRESTARDRRNWEGLRKAPFLLHFSERFSCLQNGDTDSPRSIQAEIRATLIKETNIGHIRKVQTNEKSSPIFWGQFLNSARLPAALRYLNHLPLCVELQFLLPPLKTEP